MKKIHDEKEKSYFLKGPADLDPLMERIGDAHCVLLGEASHGTHEFYTWRSAITKRLIEEKGFNFIGVEGDWPDCFRLNRYIKGLDNQDKKTIDLLHEFQRWPTWMGANWEVEQLLNWLKTYNSASTSKQKVGFYGLDVYSLWESMKSILEFLERVDPPAAAFAKKAIRCFEPYGEDEQRYAREQFRLSDSCREPLIRLLSEISKKAQTYDAADPEAALDAEQNAKVAVNAEAYYTNMMGFNDNTWNMRDRHMMETLTSLLDFHGPQSKAIVWEHNTHIGDARFTDMKDSGMYNIGQLVREARGEEDVVLVGFGAYSGTVIAAEEWGSPMQVMTVPRARSGSIEQVLHDESPEDKLLIFDTHSKQERFNKSLPHRAIGVVYHPQYEQYGNYVPTVLNSRYDAFVFLDHTRALNSVHMTADPHQVPEGYPFGF